MANQFEIQSASVQDILELLQKQNEVLENIQALIKNSLQADNATSPQVRTRITDINMSIGSMINLSFKWLIASIPVGFVVWFVILFILQIINNLS